MDLFFYNTGILEAVNLDRPPRTRAELIAAARAVAAGGSAFPLALGLEPSDPLALRRDIYPWIWAAGGDLRLPGGETPALSRIAEDTLAFFDQLHREGLLAPDSLGKTGAQRLEEFAGGTIAMLVASSRDLPFLQRSASDINFDITAVPALEIGRNRLGLSHVYAGISSACAQPDEAWAFLAFIAEKSPLLAQAAGAIPGSLFSNDSIPGNPLHSKAWDIFEAAEIVEHYPEDPSLEEIDRIIREMLTATFN